MTAQPKLKVRKPDSNYLSGMDNEEYLISLNIDQTEFSNNVTVNFDNRFRWNQWRVRGNGILNYWIADIVLQKVDNRPLISRSEAIEIAYKRFVNFQDHKGQLNTCNMYMRGVEKIELLQRSSKNGYDNATLSVVQDELDRQWRWAISFGLGNGGEGFGCWYRSETFPTREEALNRAISHLEERIQARRDRNEKDARFDSSSRQVENSIKLLQREMAQPTLFG